MILNNNLVAAAEGTVSPWVEGAMVHHKPLTLENARVCIENVIRADVPLPLPWDGFVTVGDAAGSFAQWPKSLITLLGNEVYSYKFSALLCRMYFGATLIVFTSFQNDLRDPNRKEKSKETMESATKVAKKVSVLS